MGHYLSNESTRAANAICNSMKTCTKCKQTKSNVSFHPDRRKRADGLRAQCRDCRNMDRIAYRHTKPAKDRITAHKKQLKRYGLSLVDYHVMLAKQANQCAICGTDTPNGGKGVFCVDHDHSTGLVRGLLCSNCNRGLGLFKDDPVVTKLATVYLNRHKTAVTTY